MTWKVLLVGLGSIGFKYDLKNPKNIVQTHARAFDLHDKFKMVGGVDPLKANKEQFQKAYRIPTFKTITCAFESVKADVVVIASPTQNHLENLLEVLSCIKPRVILLEKPAAYTKEQVQKMVDISAEFSVPILINFVRRTDYSVTEIMKRINSGIIKLPCKGVVWYSKGFIHNACHFIDLLSLWLGTPKKIEVLDAGKKVNNFDSEPDLRIQFSDSIIYFIAKSNDEIAYYNIELLAKNGKLNFGSRDDLINWQSRSKTNAGLDPTLHKIKNELYKYQLNVVNDIERFLNGQSSLLPTLETHLQDMYLVYEIISTNRMKI